MEGIQIQVEKLGRQQQIAALKITGYIDTTTASELERMIQRLLQEGIYQLVIDLAAVDYISSAGWGIFISEIKNIRSHRGDLKLARMSSGVTEVYELLEFATILASVPTVEEAVRGFEGTVLESAKSKTKESGALPPAAKSVGAATPSAGEAPKTGASPTPQPALPNQPAAAHTADSEVSSDTPASAPEMAAAAQAGSLMDRMKEVIRRHPGWGAWRIKRALNKNRGANPKVGWSRIRAALNYHGLTRKADRLKLAQGR